MNLDKQPKERLGTLEAIVGGIIFFAVISFFLFFFVQGWAVLFFFAFLAAYLAYNLYNPKPKPGVSVVMLATPSRKLYTARSEPYEEKKYKLAKARLNQLDLKGYIHGKSNRNVLITGSSGQGKSKLTRHLLGEMPYQKLIFSFKAGEEYLKMGYAIRDISKGLPNPFSNAEAFISAFVVAFPIGSIGIQASLIPTTLEKLVKKSQSWQDFSKNAENELKTTREANVRSALSYIKAQAPRLAYSSSGFAIGSETTVLDFSALNDDAKSFYAELALRQVYSDMEQRKRKDVLICIDEAHRLTTGNFGRYHSIIVEMSREIRDKGMLWVTTQNYTDVPDSIRNQFASQFMFKSTGQNDMVALKAIESLLAWTVSSLPNHYFVDAQFQDIHTFIPVFYYNPEREVDKAANIIAEAEAPKMAGSVSQPSKLEFFKPPEDRPTATQHAAMLAIYNNKGAPLSVLAKYLKAKGWITGDPTIYGSKGRVGVFESLAKLGLASKTSKGYELTGKGLKFIDPSAIIDGANNLGSDLHIRLMKKTIEKLHEDNMLVVAPKGSDAPDLIAYPVASAIKKKYMWDDTKRMAYEIQTNAREDAILSNSKKKEKYEIPITWISYEESILEEIKKTGSNKDKYVLIKV
jgi:energy-coupling factor transporter ATP-binding protein EcfA2